MRLTVGIATWNRAGLLGRTLQSLAGLRRPRDLAVEVLVCDNNSIDQTRRVVEDFARAQAGHLGVTYLFEPLQGKSHALNRILAAARGEWVLLLDDDVQVGEDWLEGYLAGIARFARAGVLGGPIAPHIDGPLGARALFLLRHYPGMFGVLEVDADQHMAPPRLSAWGANMALRKSVLPAEGFATDRGMVGGQRVAGEDVRMVEAVLAGGHEGWLLVQPAVRHWIRRKDLGLRRFVRWHAGLGRTWVLSRGRPAPGKLGVPWWAWRELLRRALAALIAWRPWPTRRFYDRLAAAAQQWGYLRSRMPVTTSSAGVPSAPHPASAAPRPGQPPAPRDPHSPSADS